MGLLNACVRWMLLVYVFYCVNFWLHIAEAAEPAEPPATEPAGAAESSIPETPVTQQSTAGLTNDTFINDSKNDKPSTDTTTPDVDLLDKDSSEIPSTENGKDDETQQGPNADEFSLPDLIKKHFESQKQFENYPETLATSLVEWFEQTAEFVRGSSPLPPTIEQALKETNKKSSLLKLEQFGLIHLTPPELEEHIHDIKSGIAASEASQFWWKSTTLGPPIKSNIFKKVKRFTQKLLRRMLPSGAVYRLWDACKTTNNQKESENAKFSLLESLLAVDKMAHVALETAMVGLFGICTPHFFLTEGDSFDCGNQGKNKMLLEAGLYLSLPEVAHLPTHEKVPLELGCKLDSWSHRAQVLDAIATPFSKSLKKPEDKQLAFIPMESFYETPLLDKASPPWYLLLRGTYYDNAGVDILERLNTFEQIVNALPLKWSELQFHSQKVITHLCLEDPEKAAWILGQPNEEKKTNSLILGGVVVSLLKVLKSITGPKGRETKDWKKINNILTQKVEGSLPPRKLEIVYKYMQVYAKYIEANVLSRLIPISARAMALLFVGLWAREEETFSFTTSEAKAKVLLLLALLVNRKGPVAEAAKLLGSTVKDPKQNPRVMIGSVVRVATKDPSGTPMIIFNNNRGLVSPFIVLRNKKMENVLMRIAVNNPDPLAPLKAAASVMNTIHRAKLNGTSSSKLGLAEPQILKTRFGAEIHCLSIEAETIRFLSSRAARQLGDQRMSLIANVVSTIRFPLENHTEDVELRCAFSSDTTAIHKMLKAASASRGMLRKLGGLFFRLGQGFTRFLRARLQSKAEAGSGVDERLLVKKDFVARVQMEDDWTRLFEVGTGMSLSALSHMKTYDEPTKSLTAPLNLNKQNNVGKQVLIATDYDDTLVASGGWRLRAVGKYLGGVDGSYPRGTAYPGIGGLMYLLSMGSTKRENGTLRPLDSEVLPVMLLTARPYIKLKFRPANMYKHIASIFTHEARLLGAKLPHKNYKVKFENSASIFATLCGKTFRGMTKIPTLLQLLRRGAMQKNQKGKVFNAKTKFIFIGDTYEKDLLTGLSFALLSPSHYIATFLHLVYHEEPFATATSVPPTFLKDSSDQAHLPEEALLFKIPITDAATIIGGGTQAFITGAFLSFKVKLPTKQYNKFTKQSANENGNEGFPCEHLDLKTAWSVSEKVDGLIRTIWTVHRHRWMHNGLHEMLRAAKLPPPPVFVNCVGVIPGNGNSIELQHFPKDHNTPLDPAKLGKPVIPYTTALGAMTTARVFGMVDDVDFADFATLVGRADRSLHPPTCEEDLQAARALAYDAEVAASLFPVKVASILSYSRVRQTAAWSSLGRAYENEQCKRNVKKTFRNLESTPNLLSSSGPLLEEKQMQKILNILADRVCVIKEILSNVCVVAQQEVEKAALEFAYLTQKLIGNEENRCHSLPSQVMVKLLSHLCKAYPVNCEPLVNFARDAASLASLHYKRASEDKFSEKVLSSVGFSPVTNPSILLKYARSHQGLLHLLVRRPIKFSPWWHRPKEWEQIAKLTKVLEKCVLLDVEDALKKASDLSDFSFIQKETVQEKKTKQIDALQLARRKILTSTLRETITVSNR